MAKIFSGETFGEYCERLTNLRKAGKTLFGDVKEGTLFVRGWDKNKTVFRKAGNYAAIAVEGGTLITCVSEEIVEIQLDKAAQSA